MPEMMRWLWRDMQRVDEPGSGVQHGPLQAK
jgi:hypothetical protein